LALWAVLLSALGLLLLSACSSETPTPTPLPPVDLIAYSGVDGHIYTIARDGTGRKRVSPETSGLVVSLLAAPPSQESEVSYSWPTWSPDATKLAFSSFRDRGSLQFEMRLFVTDIQAQSVKEVFSNPLEDTGPISYTPIIPHYTLWASSERLSFLAGVDREITFHTVNADGSDLVQEDLFRAPLYYSWSPDGTRAIVHHIEGHKLIDLSAEEHVTELPQITNSYRAPSWDPTGERYIIADDEFEGGSLVLAEADGEGKQVLIPITGDHAFHWSPDGKHIGLSELPTKPGGQSGLSLIDAETLEKQDIKTEEVFAFFWSPDSQKIAYVKENRSIPALEWWAYDLPSDEHTLLAPMRHSPDNTGLLLFFDQFAYSHGPWSPDSRYVVVAGRTIEMPRGQPSAIILLDTAGEEDPRFLAEGTLGVWSPR